MEFSCWNVCRITKHTLAAGSSQKKNGETAMGLYGIEALVKRQLRITCQPYLDVECASIPDLSGADGRSLPSHVTSS
jgi:hypothetical protein